MSLSRLIQLEGGRKTPLIRQSETNECGLACLAMVAMIQVEQSREAEGSAIGDSLAAIAAQRRLAESQVRLAGQRAASERALANA